MEKQAQTRVRKLATLENILPSVQRISSDSQSVLSLQSGFVGRENELEAIEQHFKDPSCRLLTLVGLGGVGKTRIACEAAARAANDLANGSYFIPFAPLSSPNLVATTLASSIGLFLHGSESPRTQVINYLSGHELLLVLDNFEHLMSATDLIVEILNGAPGVRMLVTSRERLNLHEEWILDIYGLDYPQDDTHDVIENYSAIQLFIKCACRAKADFQLTKTNQANIIRICRLVEGVPLAIELAASWVRVLSCQAIVDEIEHNLDFLTTSLRNVPEKHQSMRAVFEQSYKMLTAEQQQVFRKLSVFRGGFRRAAAETISETSLKILGSLVDKSLLRMSSDSHFVMHELLRQYAEEKLNASDDMEAAHNAHSAYYAEFMSSRIDDLKGRRQIEALAEITADFENVRAAWIWAAENKHAQNIEMMLEGLRLFILIRNRGQEDWKLFRFAEQAFSGEERFERLWGRLLARVDEQLETLQKELNYALQIAHHYDDLAEIALCLQRLGFIAYEQGDYAKAKQLREQSLAAYRQLGDRYHIACVLWDLMDGLRASVYEGIWDEFKRFGEESLRLRREIGDQVGIAWSIPPVAQEAMRVGRFVEAERLWLERIALGQEVGSPLLVARGYTHLSLQVYFIQGEFAKTRAAIEEALKIEAAVGFPNPGYGLATLGLLASMEEHYEEGKTLCQQGADSTSVTWMIDFAAWGSAIAACGLGDYQAANAFFSAALKCRIAVFGLVGIISCLPIAAILLAQRGEQVRAVELLALAFTHPVHACGWMEKWPLLARLCSSLEETLGTDVYAAAWEHGTRLDLDEVRAELLQLFPKEAALSSVTTLSERELEVLRLVAEGCSNQEIADRLFIGLSTVKKHINHIYDKLDAKNRTQAVAFARERQILMR